MKQILERGTPSTSELFINAFGQGAAGLAEALPQIFQKQAEREKQKKASDQYRQLTGMDIENLPPEAQLSVLQNHLKGKHESELENLKGNRKRESNSNMLRQLEKDRGLEESALQAYMDDIKLAEQVSRPEKEKTPSLTEKPVPPEIVKKIKQIENENPKANSDELRLLMDEQGIPPIYSNPYTENRRKTEESEAKITSESIKSKQKEKEFFHNESKKFSDSLSDKSNAAQRQNRALEKQLVDARKIGWKDRIVSAIAGQTKWGDLLKSSTAQEFDSYSLNQLEGKRELLGGVLSDADIRLIMQKVVTASKSPEANEAIGKWMIGENNYILAKKQIADELTRDNDGYRPKNFEGEVDRIFNERYGNEIRQKFENLISLPDDPNKIQKVGRRVVAPGTQMTNPTVIEMYLTLADNDVIKATELAREDGYDVPDPE